MSTSGVAMPDIELAIIAFLKDDFELEDLVHGRIYAELPAGVNYPALRVRRISGRAGVPRWLDAATIEVAGWGHRADASARRDARDTCELAVRALHDLQNTIVRDAVLCGPVATFGPREVPDTLASGVSNPRFIAEVSITYHPAPAGS
jgi:hypothetical protein